MYSKLAFRSIRRSFKDFSIYFVTLAFGVCVFYAFNSISEQGAVLRITQSQDNIMELLANLISYLSYFLAVVLGFLVVYANRYLIRRRKSEFAIFLTLGMSRRQVSRIIMLETALVGLISVALGLALGYLLSQVLLFVTAALFKMTLSGFTFFFSPSAALFTIACFAIMFLVTLIFNVVSVSRYQLIDLLTASRKNEGVTLRNLPLSIALFILSIVMIGVAYWLLLENGLLKFSGQFTASTILVCAGTVLFFYSLSGFLLRVVQGRKAIYFRGLNMFILRQLNSRINSAFVSISIVCMTLFLALAAMCTGFSVATVLNDNFEAGTRYDASYTVYYSIGQEDPDGSDASGDTPSSSDPNSSANSDPSSDASGSANSDPSSDPSSSASSSSNSDPSSSVNGDASGSSSSSGTSNSDASSGTPDSGKNTLTRVERAATASNFDMAAAFARDVEGWHNLVAASAQIDLYKSGLTLRQMLEMTSFLPKGVLEMIIGDPSDPTTSDILIMAVKLSQYNELRALLGEAPVTLDEKQLLFWYDVAELEDFYQSVLEQNEHLPAFGSQFALASKAQETIPWNIGRSPSNRGLLIVPDSAIPADMTPDTSMLNLMYAGPRADIESSFEAAVAAAYGSAWQNPVDAWPYLMGDSSEQLVNNGSRLSGVVSYLAIYIGLILLVTCAAILALQQLTEAVDNTRRYALLGKIGAEQRALDRALFSQIGIYFVFPLLLALAHATVAMSVSEDVVQLFGKMDIVMPLFITAAVAVAIYGGYFLITCFTARATIRGRF